MHENKLNETSIDTIQNGSNVEKYDRYFFIIIKRNLETNQKLFQFIFHFFRTIFGILNRFSIFSILKKNLRILNFLIWLKR